MVNRYEEKDLKVGRKKTNVMFIGDGMGKTIIRGKRSVADGLTTFHTASFGKLFNYIYLLSFSILFSFLFLIVLLKCL